MRKLFSCWLIVISIVLAPRNGEESIATAETAPPEKKLPMPGEVFLVEGCTAFVIPAKKARSADGQDSTDANAKDRRTPWVWYAPTLPNLPGPEEQWMFERFTKAGIAVAGIDVGESYGSPAGRKLFSAFHRELMEKRGFSSKPVLLGRSRGGLMTLGWAAENPDKVGGFAGIYPVCNIASYPGIARACGAYGLTEAELTAKLAEHNPLDRLAALAKAKVPLFAIHGDVDKIVPLEANSGEVHKRYEKLGGKMQLIVPAGQGHNMWPGFFQSQELVDFVIAKATGRDSPPAANRSSATHADDQPVLIGTSATGHVHPSICRTRDGTLVVVFKGANVLMCSRSTDSGATWSTPAPITTTAKRPEVIRDAPTFEVYPGTADVFPDDRILVTWNYIADDKKKDGYYERALLYTISSDQGRTWSDQSLIGPADGKHLGAVRHNVLSWPDGRWLLPLRVGPPRLFDPKTGELSVLPLTGPDRKQHSFQQVVRTPKGTLLAMGPVMLRSTDEGRTWSLVEGFRSVPDIDTAEGRYLTVLRDGRLLVTFGIGTVNKGLSYNFSADDGLTWNNDQTVVLLPDRGIAARYYSARTVQLDDQHVGTVFLSSGVQFLNVSIERIAR